MRVLHHSQSASVREDEMIVSERSQTWSRSVSVCGDPPLLMAVAQEGAVVGGVRLAGQPQQQHLGEAKRQRELTPQLPHAVQQQQEDRRLLLETGVGVGRAGAALLERVPRLQQKEKSLLESADTIFSKQNSLHNL